MKTIFITLVFLFLCSPARAVWISATPEAVVDNITVGKECSLSPVVFPLFVKNKGNEAVWVYVKDIRPDVSLMRAGFEPIPLLSKVVIPGSKIKLSPGERKEVKAMLMFPRCGSFLGKQYQFHISYSAVPVNNTAPALAHGAAGVGVNPGVESVVLFTTHEEMGKTEIELAMDASGGEIEDPEVITVTIPIGALGKPVKINIKELRGDEIPKKPGTGGLSDPVIVFKFEPAGTVFKKPVKISMYYPDFDDDGLVDGLNIKAENLKMFYWDGYRWDVVGGTVDLSKKCITTEIYHFSVYGLFEAGEKMAEDIIPLQKIITPAKADGKNDFISFPGLQGNYTIDIFDVTGTKVISLENKSIWYGLDQDGNLVESGPYIYKYSVDFNGEKKTVTGVVVVAK